MNKVPIKIKLTLMICFSVAAMVVMCIVASMGFSNTLKTMNDLTKVRLPAVVALGIINEGKTAIRSTNRRMLIYQNDPNAQTQFAEIIKIKAATWARVEKGLQLYRSTPKTLTEDQYWEDFSKVWNIWKQGETPISSIHQALVNNHDPDIQKLLFAHLVKKMEAQHSAFSAVEEVLAKITDTTFQTVDASKQNLEDSVKFAWWLMFWSGVFSISITLIVGSFLIRSITNPLAQSVKLAQNIAKGDLSTQIIIKGETEIDMLLRALIEMQSVIKEIIASQNKVALDFAQSQFYLKLEPLNFPGSFGDIAKTVNHMVQNSQAQSEKLAKILESMVDGLITIDKHGQVLSFNPAAERIFGYKAPEIIGRNIKVLMPEPYMREHDGYLQNYLKTGVPKVIGIGREVTGMRLDGSHFPMDLAVSPMSIEGDLLFIGVVRDISERKKIDLMKTEFIATVSHELRTPLTSIQGALELILSGVMGSVPLESETLLKIASSNCSRLVRLINDILDIEKIESGKMIFQIKKLDVFAVVNEAVTFNQAFAKEYGITLNVDQELPTPYIAADHDMLIQVLTNLIANAVKFSPKGGHVDISVKVSDTETLSIGVSDYGVGIPDEFKTRIFEKFSQADGSASRTKGGTGLGLSISKSIVEQLGGSIRYDSVPNIKTSFFVEFPLIKPEKISDISPETPPKKRLLICEDDPDVANLLKLMLENKGYSADIALSAETAKPLLKNNSYAALVLDLILPGQSGIDFFKELRQVDSTRRLPVIVVSNMAKKGEKALDKAPECVYGWLDKPIDPALFDRAILSALKQKGKTANRILHIEDDADIVQLVRAMLQDSISLDVAPTLKKAKELLEQAYDLIILDLNLPDGSGISLLPIISQQFPSIPVVIFSANEIKETLPSCVIVNFIKSKTSNETLINAIDSIINVKN